jgi:hypothetical protein
LESAAIGKSTPGRSWRILLFQTWQPLRLGVDIVAGYHEHPTPITLMRIGCQHDRWQRVRGLDKACTFQHVGDDLARGAPS